MAVLRARLQAFVRDVAATARFASGVTRPRNAHRLTIVTFHRVLPESELRDYPIPEIAVTPEELAWFLSELDEYFECDTLERAHERWRNGANGGRPPLAITFDDGQLDNFRHARPVLDGAGVRATFFAVSGAAESRELLWHDRAAYALTSLLRRDEARARDRANALGVDPSTPSSRLPPTVVERLKLLAPDARLGFIDEIERGLGGRAAPAWDGMMGFEELDRLAREEHEIGSHSHSHPILTRVDDAALRDELVTSRALLEQRLKTPITSLCYPNGDADARVVAAARAAGYRRAVTTRWGWNPRGADPFQLTRCDMQGPTARSRSGELSRARLAWRISGLYPGL